MYFYSIISILRERGWVQMSQERIQKELNHHRIKWMSVSILYLFLLYSKYPKEGGSKTKWVKEEFEKN